MKYQQSQLPIHRLFFQIASFITGTNRARGAYFSARRTRSDRRRNEKQIHIRACIRTSIVLRVKTAQLRGCTSVSSGSLHACMMNSLRRLLLSEVTGHKVMTVAVLRIPQFYSALFAQFSHASFSRPIRALHFLVIVFNCTCSCCILLYAGNCSGILWLLPRFCFRVSSTVFHL